MSEVEAEFLGCFATKANERLDNMVDTLLALEGGRAGPEALDSLFRDAMTIKGGAGMLGLGRCAYARPPIEDGSTVREQRETFPVQLADPLLRAADALRLHVAGESAGTPDLLEELGASRARGDRRRRAADGSEYGTCARSALPSGFCG